MLPTKSPFFRYLLTLLASAGLAALVPQERNLSTSIRIVYLHGAWALTAEVGLGAATAAGLIGVLTRRKGLLRWSTALGYSGLFFWLTYLPFSMGAMQANWNGLFLDEPRFRVAVIFSITGVLLQAGLALLERPFVTSLANLLFFTALLIDLFRADYVMHPPPSPIFSSGILFIQLFFIGITILTITSAYFMARWWITRIR